jgi:hypothetical protein
LALLAGTLQHGLSSAAALPAGTEPACIHARCSSKQTPATCGGAGRHQQHHHVDALTDAALLLLRCMTPILLSMAAHRHAGGCHLARRVHTHVGGEGCTGQEVQHMVHPVIVAQIVSATCVEWRHQVGDHGPFGRVHSSGSAYGTGPLLAAVWCGWVAYLKQQMHEQEQVRLALGRERPASPGCLA